MYIKLFRRRDKAHELHPNVCSLREFRSIPTLLKRDFVCSLFFVGGCGWWFGKSAC